MGELVFSVFTEPEGATRVLGELRARGTAPEGVASAGTVSVLESGSYTVGTTDHPGSCSGFSGVFWEALFGLVPLVHVPGSSYGPSTGALFETIRHAGVDEGFRARAREALTDDSTGVRSSPAPKNRASHHQRRNRQCQRTIQGARRGRGGSSSPRPSCSRSAPSTSSRASRRC